MNSYQNINQLHKALPEGRYELFLNSEKGRKPIGFFHIKDGIISIEDKGDNKFLVEQTLPEGKISPTNIARLIYWISKNDGQYHIEYVGPKV